MNQTAMPSGVEHSNTETRTTDAKGRLVLPKSFANSTVLVDVIDDQEIRIRRARVVPESELLFREEQKLLLSDADRDQFLSLLSDSPPANLKLKKAYAKYRKSNRD